MQLSKCLHWPAWGRLCDLADLTVKQTKNSQRDKETKRQKDLHEWCTFSVIDFLVGDDGVHGDSGIRPADAAA